MNVRFLYLVSENPADIFNSKYSVIERDVDILDDDISKYPLIFDDNTPKCYVNCTKQHLERSTELKDSINRESESNIYGTYKKLKHNQFIISEYMFNRLGFKVYPKTLDDKTLLNDARIDLVGNRFKHAFFVFRERYMLLVLIIIVFLYLAFKQAPL